MKVLLTGANGQLGQHLRRQVPEGIELVALTSQDLDITAATSVQSAVARYTPDVIINTAAYTQVDKAESESARAFAVNADGVASLVAATPATTRIVHISTDFVFDGRKTSPYEAGDATNPLSVYGSSKRAGELKLLEHAPARSCIIRTAWLYSAGSKNFMDTMLKLMQTRDSLRVVADQRGTPTSCITLADAVWRAVQRPTVTGILHWTDEGETTWHGFATAIQRLGMQHGLLDRQIPIAAIATHEYPTPAVRPAYSVLAKASTFAALGMQAPQWQQALEQVIRERRRLSLQQDTLA